MPPSVTKKVKGEATPAASSAFTIAAATSQTASNATIGPASASSSRARIPTETREVVAKTWSTISLTAAADALAAATLAGTATVDRTVAAAVTDLTKLFDAAASRFSERSPRLARPATAAPTIGPIAATISVGNDASALVALPNSHYIYVTNADDGTVSVIDTNTNTTVGTPISLGATPYEIVSSRDGSKVYVSGSSFPIYATDGTAISNNVVVPIDTSTNTAGAPIVLNIHQGWDPIMALEPDGKHLYVDDMAANSVEVIDTQTGRVSGSISIEGPTDIALTPDGTRLYVTSQRSGQVSAVDTASNAVIATIPVAEETSEIMSPDGSRLYVWSGSTEVAAINTATNSVVNMLSIPHDRGGATYGTNGADWAISSDSRYLYTYNYSDGLNPAPVTISIVDTATSNVVTIPVGDSVSAAVNQIAASADGHYLYAISGNDVIVVDTSNYTVSDPIHVGNTVGGDFNHVAIAPNGQVYVATAYNNTVVNINPSAPITFHNGGGSGSGGGTGGNGSPIHLFPSKSSLITALNDVFRSDDFSNFISNASDLAAIIGLPTVAKVFNFATGFIAGYRGDAAGAIFAATGTFGDGLAEYGAATKNPVLYLAGIATSTWSYTLDQAAQADFSDPGSTVHYAVTHPVETVVETAKATVQVVSHVTSTVVGSLGGLLHFKWPF